MHSWLKRVLFLLNMFFLEGGSPKKFTFGGEHEKREYERRGRSSCEIAANDISIDIESIVKNWTWLTVSSIWAQSSQIRVPSLKYCPELHRQQQH